MEKNEICASSNMRRTWYNSEYMVFVFGENINENTGLAAKYILCYGFRDPAMSGGVRVEYREIIPFIFYTQAAEFLTAIGYEFFPAGADDPLNLTGVWI